MVMTLSRAQRRALARAKPVKQRVTRLINPTIVETALVFAPIDKWLAQLRQGYTLVSESGAPIMTLHGDCETHYATIPALEGWLEAWERMSRDIGFALDMRPLEKVCKRLDYSVPLTPADVEKAAAVVEEMRRVYRRLDVRDIKSSIDTTCIAIELDRIGGAEGLAAITEGAKA